MNENTMAMLVRLILLLLGLFYIGNASLFISIGKITRWEGCLVVGIGLGQIWAAYVLKSLGGGEYER